MYAEQVFGIGKLHVKNHMEKWVGLGGKFLRGFVVVVVFFYVIFDYFFFLVFLVERCCGKRISLKLIANKLVSRQRKVRPIVLKLCRENNCL